MRNASFVKIAEKLDVSAIVEALNKNPQLWDEHNHRRVFDGSPHAEMVDIWVRFGDISEGFEKLREPHDSVWYDSSNIIDGVRDVAFQLMALVQGERLGGILITKLGAGNEILPHVDKGWHAEYYEKFYVSIKSPKGSKFCFEDGAIESKAGDVYLFRNDRLHWVKNDTTEERITMVVCIKTDFFRGV